MEARSRIRLTSIKKSFWRRKQIGEERIDSYEEIFPGLKTLVPSHPFLQVFILTVLKKMPRYIFMEFENSKDKENNNSAFREKLLFKQNRLSLIF